MYRHAAAMADRLGLFGAERAAAHFYFRHYLILVAVGILSAALAAAGIVHYGIPGWVYGLLGPLCYYHGVRYGYRPDLDEQVYS